MRSTWTELFAEVRRVYGNVSTLLLDAGRAMALHGFQVAHGKANQIGIERSGNIHEPDFWAPAWVARFYRSEKAPPPGGPVLYIGCVLSDEGGADFELPKDGEPVVTAGILHYGAKGSHWDWRYWHAKSWFWQSKDRLPDGKWTVAEHESWHQWGIRRIESFALPLLSLKSRSELDALVIHPLVERSSAPPQKDVFDLIADLAPGTRTKEDIDDQIAEERAAWG